MRHISYEETIVVYGPHKLTPAQVRSKLLSIGMRRSGSFTVAFLYEHGDNTTVHQLMEGQPAWLWDALYAEGIIRREGSKIIIVPCKNTRIFGDFNGGR